MSAKAHVKFSRVNDKLKHVAHWWLGSVESNHLVSLQTDWRALFIMSAPIITFEAAQEAPHDADPTCYS